MAGDLKYATSPSRIEGRLVAQPAGHQWRYDQDQQPSVFLNGFWVCCLHQKVPYDWILYIYTAPGQRCASICPKSAFSDYICLVSETEKGVGMMPTCPQVKQLDHGQQSLRKD
jgi:hypothetical protein